VVTAGDIEEGRWDFWCRQQGLVYCIWWASQSTSSFIGCTNAHNWTTCIDFDFTRIFRYRWAFEKFPWNYLCLVYIMHFAKTIWGLCSWVYCLSVWVCWLCALFNLLPNVVDWNLKSFPRMPVPHLENLLKRVEGLAPGKSLWHLDPSGRTWFTTDFKVLDFSVALDLGIAVFRFRLETLLHCHLPCTSLLGSPLYFTC
jgi:hypothetical protein